MHGDDPEVKISIASLQNISRTSSDYSSPGTAKATLSHFKNHGWADRAAKSPPASWHTEKWQLVVNTLQKPLISIYMSSLGLHR